MWKDRIKLILIKFVIVVQIKMFFQSFLKGFFQKLLIWNDTYFLTSTNTTFVVVIFANKKHRLDTMERIHTIEYDTGKSGHLSFRKERYILIFQSDMIDDTISHRFHRVNFVCTLLSLRTLDTWVLYHSGI